jgi:Ni/Fe-hydrogenase subunit HybB-like protein
MYAVYIRNNCEELGCVVIVLPIIGIMAISIIEFLINMWAYSKRYYFSTERKVVFAISGIISGLSLLLFLFSLIN